MIRVAICDDDREYGMWLEMEIFKLSIVLIPFSNFIPNKF